MTRKTKILIGSPVHQKPAILHKFLLSLLRLRHDRTEFEFDLIDDNRDPISSSLLQQFAKTVEDAKVTHAEEPDEYRCDEITHSWNEHLIWKVAQFKNELIQHAVDRDFDYLFLIDSDLLLHPNTIETLLNAEKDIVSEIFWTRWRPDSLPEPQVWLRDQYELWEQERWESLSKEEITKRYERFIATLHVPGVYQVGGLGACTLISRRALLAGVNFNPIYNVSFWGEDRHFCIRAAALGFSLHVDTHVPAYHIYRESDLPGADEFMVKTMERPAAPFIDRKRPNLTLSMIVRNEAGRYLEQVLREHRRYIDQAVIIDDGSTDSTAELVARELQGIPVRLVRNDVSRFSNEVELRKQQWEETIRMDPEWILNLDADEWFEDRFATEVRALLLEPDVDLYCFRLYDFWSPTHYREDRYWRSHSHYRPFLVRYRDDVTYSWKETAQHCGRLPDNIFTLPHRISPLRLKHYGWAEREHRLEKYRRYMELDPEGSYGWKEQYASILDECPNLVPWIE